MVQIICTIIAVMGFVLFIHGVDIDNYPMALLGLVIEVFLLTLFIFDDKDGEDDERS